MDKIIPNFSNYTINEHGVITSYIRKTPRIMKQRKDYKGYMVLEMIDDEGVERHARVNRLVALTFIPNPQNKPVVNHIDCNKENNHVSNLEWLTDLENQNHAFENKLKKDDRKKIAMKDLEGNEIARFDSINECAKHLGTNQYTISRVVSGIRKTYKRKYVFELV